MASPRSSTPRLLPLLAATTLLAAAPAALAQTPMRIMVDAGHGDSDSGAVGNGLVEKDLNLAVAQRLKELLELDTTDTSGGSAWDVRMTRETDIFVSLSGRSSAANAWPAEVFVSIHHNAFGSSSANGTETFSFSNGTQSAALRDLVQEELLLAAGLNDRGARTANFHVLRETNMPAVLSEGGFLTSPVDAAALSAPGYVEAAALAHLYALQRWRGVPAHEPTNGPTNYCVGKLSGLGCLPAISATGNPSLSGSTPVTVTGTGITHQQFGLMIWSETPSLTPFFGGTLCVSGSIIRTPIQNAGGAFPSTCDGVFNYDLTPSYLASFGLQPGDQIHCQYWFREPFSTIQVGLTDAVTMTILP